MLNLQNSFSIEENKKRKEKELNDMDNIESVIKTNGENENKQNEENQDKEKEKEIEIEEDSLSKDKFKNEDSEGSEKKRKRSRVGGNSTKTLYRMRKDIEDFFETKFQDQKYAKQALALFFEKNPEWLSDVVPLEYNKIICMDIVERIESIWDEKVLLLIKYKLGLSDEKLEFLSHTLSQRYIPTTDKYIDIELFPGIPAPKFPVRKKLKDYTLQHFGNLDPTLIGNKLSEQIPHRALKKEKTPQHQHQNQHHQQQAHEIVPTLTTLKSPSNVNKNLNTVLPSKSSVNSTPNSIVILNQDQNPCSPTTTTTTTTTTNRMTMMKDKETSNYSQNKFNSNHNQTTGTNNSTPLKSQPNHLSLGSTFHSEIISNSNDVNNLHDLNVTTLNYNSKQTDGSLSPEQQQQEKEETSKTIQIPNSKLPPPSNSNSNLNLNLNSTINLEEKPLVLNSHGTQQPQQSFPFLSSSQESINHFENVNNSNSNSNSKQEETHPQHSVNQNQSKNHSPMK